MATKRKPKVTSRYEAQEIPSSTGKPYPDYIFPVEKQPRKKYGKLKYAKLKYAKRMKARS